MFDGKIMSKQTFRKDHYNVNKEEVNKIALSSNYDKRLQTSDRITTYLYGLNEMLAKDEPNSMYY